MAYSGFLSDEEYTRRSQDEVISGKWTFNGKTTFTQKIQGTAIAAYYADLAEYYEFEMSESIPSGSVVMFGGEKEITKTKPNGKNFFGIISTKPGLILNKSKNKSENFAPVALFGKTPCRVNGIVHKFDKLTTSKIKGVAKKKTFIDSLLGKPTIGISLEDKTQDKTEKLIEIFVRANI